MSEAGWSYAGHNGEVYVIESSRQSLTPDELVVELIELIWHYQASHTHDDYDGYCYT